MMRLIPLSTIISALTLSTSANLNPRSPGCRFYPTSMQNVYEQFPGKNGYFSAFPSPPRNDYTEAFQVSKGIDTNKAVGSRIYELLTFRDLPEGSQCWLRVELPPTPRIKNDLKPYLGNAIPDSEFPVLDVKNFGAPSPATAPGELDRTLTWGSDANEVGRDWTEPFDNIVMGGKYLQSNIISFESCPSSMALGFRIGGVNMTGTFGFDWQTRDSTGFYISNCSTED